MQRPDSLALGAQGMLGRVVYENDLGAWLLAAGIFAAATLLLFLLRRVLVRRLGARTRLTSTDVDDLGIQLVGRTRAYFILALALVAAAQVLALPERLLGIGHVVVVVATLFQLAVWGTALIDYALRRYAARDPEHAGASKMVVGVAGFILRALLWGIILLLALENLGFDVTALVAGLGIGGIAVALAVQNVLGDILAAMAIVADKPFVVGDFIIVGDYMGTVENIGMKTTRLRSLGGEQIVIANSDLIGSRIRNYKRMYERRVVFGLRVVYDTAPRALERVSAILREAVEAQDGVRFDRAHFVRFGEWGLEYEVVYHVLSPDYNVYMNIQQAINLALVSRFAEDGIEFAFPTRTVHVSGRLEGTAAAGTADRA